MLKPIHDQIIIERHANKTESEGGIHLSGPGDEQPYATVLAVGDGVKENIKPGDVILYDLMGWDVDHEGKSYRFIRQENVQAVL